MGSDGENEESSDSEDLNDPFESNANLRYLRLGEFSQPTLPCLSQLGIGGTGKNDSESDTEDESSGTDGDTEDNASVASDGADAKGDLPHDPWISLRWKDEFGREAFQTIKRGVDENIRLDDIALELKTLRMANNADMDRVKVMVVAFFLKQMPIVTGDSAKQKEVAKDIFGKWGSLITTLCQGEMHKALLRLQVRP